MPLQFDFQYDQLKVSEPTKVTFCIIKKNFAEKEKILFDMSFFFF